MTSSAPSFCPCCNSDKTPADFFSRLREGTRRYSARCKDCENARRKEYRRTHKAETLLAGAKSRAKRFGIPFSITVDDIYIGTHCPVLGTRFPTAAKHSLGPSPTSPTLDRINNVKGYVPGNVVVVSFRANRAKGDLTTDELVKVASFYQRLA